MDGRGTTVPVLEHAGFFIFGCAFHCKTGQQVSQFRLEA
jgi:hypothetical protein